ncbi:sigma factor-like helix-turn-helix DNA-binding protein [Streptomyces sp. SBC-4]|nr:sigma factor-like helix-turn-helix DNA-binding protein [Streptomyces sp. SBC-4]MDV5147857.1 sigma factor-like helix-turn-helix DNA-binding protein [Streptomyces sp. SBC-4]
MSRSTTDSASSATLPTPKERRRLREALALSEEQVAEAMGVTKATVKAWETGRSAPRGRKREAYAKLLCAAEVAETARAPEHTPPAPTPMSTPTSTPTYTATPMALPSASASPSASVRPLAAVKRAAKPPKAPSPVPALAPGAVRQGASKPPERLKPAEAEAAPEAHPEPVPEPVPAPAPAQPPVEPGLTPAEAFDALYAHAAPGLVHQTYLLTGRRRLSRESVEYAFHHAWEHWPEVAVDADPVGWVRAAAYEYALSPWHRLRRAHKHPDAPPTEVSRRALLAALLELPPPYRRTVLLYDGLGLDLPDTAAETEASTPAAANRLLHARTVIGQQIPELAEPETLHRRLHELVAEAPTATLPAARAVRTGSERRTRKWTRTVLGVTAALICVTAFTAATAPTRYLPVEVPGETVNGVPVRGGPQKLGPEDVELRDRLRNEPNPGPERLIPSAE